MTLDDLQRGQMFAALRLLRCSMRVDGATLKNLRKVLGYSQRDLGSLIDYQHETLSRWENDAEPIPRVVHVALIGLLARGMLGETPEEMLGHFAP